MGLEKGLYICLVLLIHYLSMLLFFNILHNHNHYRKQEALKEKKLETYFANTWHKEADFFNANVVSERCGESKEKDEEGKKIV